jgi:hypothetical protein
MRNVTYKTGPCETCGTEFQRTGPRSKYCSKECKPSSYTHTCAWCSKAYTSKAKDQHFCSSACYGESGEAAKSGGGRPRSREGAEGFHPDAPEAIYCDERYGAPKSWSCDRGYVFYYWPDHPKATAGGRLLEHRAVMYALYGDAIDDMHVDHIDADRRNNHPLNLQLLTHQEHMQKTANTEGPAAFLTWCKENLPEAVDAWKAAR